MSGQPVRRDARPVTVTDLARLQFGLTAGAHYLFVALTLGLVTLLVLIQLADTAAPSPGRAAMLRFWGQVYLVNYALGIGTGIVMELQLALNWAGLTRTAGEVVGAPLALETVVAFAAEATLLGLWIFARDRMPRVVHLTVLVGVALTAYASAFFVIAANAFLQNPVGYAVRDGIMTLTDPGSLFTNVALPTALVHVLAAALLTGGLFVAGVSSACLWWGRRRPVDAQLFRSSQRLGVVVAAVAGPATVVAGGLQFGYLGTIQPTKLSADDPDAVARLAEWTARFGPGDRLPDPGLLGTAEASMFGFGLLAVLVALLALVLLPLLPRWRPLQAMLVLAAVLPFLANTGGWLFRELGRAPWAIYGVLPVEQGVTPTLTGTRAVGQLVLFAVLIVALVLADAAVMARMVRRYAPLPRPGWLLWPDAPAPPSAPAVPSLVPGDPAGAR